MFGNQSLTSSLRLYDVQYSCRKIDTDNILGFYYFDITLEFV